MEPEIKIEQHRTNDCDHEIKIKVEKLDKPFDTQKNKNFGNDIKLNYFHNLWLNPKFSSTKSAAQRMRECQERKHQKQEQEEFKKFSINTSFSLTATDKEKYETYLLLKRPKSNAQCSK